METNKSEKKRIAEILQSLSRAYPDARPELEFSSPFELLVATILSAQCTDKQVNKCTRELFPVYNTPEQIGALSEEELGKYVHSCGFYKTKGKNIIAASRIICEKYGGSVPRTQQQLMELPGVGRKTANVVASNAFGVPAIAVDTHVFRVSNRLGLAQADDVEKTERQLMENIPKEQWSIAHHWLIFHGRRVCAARNPKCGECPLAALCPSRQEK